MRKRDDSKKSVIVEYINEYYSDYGQTPTVRAISEGTGIAVATLEHKLFVVPSVPSAALRLNICMYLITE